MDDLFDILFPDSDDDSDNEETVELSVETKREQMKEKFYKTLKSQYFFNDEEIKPINSLIENYFIKVDDINKSVNFSEYGLISSQKMEMELLSAQKELLKEIQQKIKDTMHSKVEEAKEYFKNQKNENS